MRIVAGKHRSRIIKMVGIDTTRETTDKVRQAVFNLLSFVNIKGTGLDLFSGSGAMGLEGLSRGLDFCYFNDLNKKAYEVTKENINNLGYQKESKIFNFDYKKCLDLIDNKLDFVFLDPPYKLDSVNEILNILLEKQLLNKESYIIIEVANEYDIVIPEGLILYKERSYGIRKIVILKY